MDNLQYSKFTVTPLQNLPNILLILSIQLLLNFSFIEAIPEEMKMVPQVVIVVVVQVTYRSYRKNIFSELPSISQLLKSPQAVTYFLTLKAGSSEEFLESSNLPLNSQQSVKLFIIHFRPPPPFVPLTNQSRFLVSKLTTAAAAKGNRSTLCLLVRLA